MRWLKKIRDISLLLRVARIIGWRSLVITWKFKMMPPAKAREFINQYTHAGAKKVLKVLKIKYQIYFEQPLNLQPNQPYIFMSNHQSFMDLPLIYAALPGTIRLLAKKFLFKIPIFGEALLAGGCIPVDPQDPAAMIDFFAHAKEKLQGGLWLWIFPEGTRSQGGELLPFKSGGVRLAREIGAKIIPVAIKGTYLVLPAGKLEVRLNQRVELKVGAPIDTSQFSTIESQKQLLQKVYESIKKLLES